MRSRHLWNRRTRKERPMATVQQMGGRTFEKEIFIRATPERVWRALTERAELEQWFMRAATLDLRPGGALVHDWGDSRKGGTFLVVDPPHRVVFTWDERPRCDGATTIAITLTAEGDGTRLHLLHSGYGG